jgi:threonine dehydrogenase-like Zn-dependent dehydrogenase
MKTKLLHSFEAKQIGEYEWEKPEITADEIEIKTLLCGICRSDVGSYNRWELMPYTDSENTNGKLGGFGHEGLGIVTKIGTNITDVKVGEIVSTWGDPAFAYYYNVKKGEYAIVPEATAKYILQPTACSINIAVKTLDTCTLLQRNENPNILLLGSGFMSLVIGQYFIATNKSFDIVGSSNKDEWAKLGVTMKSIKDVTGNQYDAVIDLTSKAENWNLITELKLLRPEGILCYASTPYTPVTTNFFEQCWNCFTIIMPSPRNSDFGDIMKLTANLIMAGHIDPTPYWTHAYDRRDIESVKLGFEEGSNRTPEYIRGFLVY